MKKEETMRKIEKITYLRVEGEGIVAYYGWDFIVDNRNHSAIEILDMIKNSLPKVIAIDLEREIKYFYFDSYKVSFKDGNQAIEFEAKNCFGGILMYNQSQKKTLEVPAQSEED
ncbi:MAG: hypothetical protein NT116_03990 [Candidatus Parcubacteria bacterium]|nr:hypothetical protein [Candidatus Parcubacteria bacterium]